MAKLSQKPEWTSDLPAGASIVAIIEGQLYRLANSLFVGPKGDKGDKGDPGADGADGADGTDAPMKQFSPDETQEFTTDTLTAINGLDVNIDAGKKYLIRYFVPIQYVSGGIRFTITSPQADVNDYYAFSLHGVTPTNTFFGSSGGGLSPGWMSGGLHHSNVAGLQALYYDAIVQSDVPQTISLSFSTNSATGSVFKFPGAWVTLTEVA